ncbi:hypothetical protein DL771_006365 [Monosporascus sp. 5C6A]|nr:hypothetical protein DL771_006365 [Monosporascus sp. 5C6A]
MTKTGLPAAVLILASRAHGWQVALYCEDECEGTAAEALAGENEQNTECCQVSSNIMRSFEAEGLDRVRYCST